MGQTINTEYYLSLLVQLKDIMKKERHCKFTKGVLFFHDNAPTHPALSTKTNVWTWGSNMLITQPIFRIRPRLTTIFSEDWKFN
jgi:hypothetical protein